MSSASIRTAELSILTEHSIENYRQYYVPSIFQWLKCAFLKWHTVGVYQENNMKDDTPEGNLCMLPTLMMLR